MQPRAFSLRDVPAIIYVAIGLSVSTTFLYLVVAVAKGTHDFDFETFKSMALWRTIDQTANDAYAVLFPLGMLALARRQIGPGRTMTMVGAALGFIGLLYLGLDIVLVVVQPREDIDKIYQAMGYLTGLTQIAGAVLLTIGAGAWRRVPVAAAFLFVLIATSYWVPVIGKGISEAIGRDLVLRQIYAVIRECGWAACNLFIAGAIAAQARWTPEPATAASGFRIARGALVARLVIGIVLLFGVITSVDSPTAAKVVAVGTPLVALVTMLIVAIALVRVSTSAVEGLPRFRLAIGAGSIAWWTFVQFYQLGQLYSVITGKGSIDEDYDQVGALAIAGPIVVAIGLGLIGSGAAALAAHRGNHHAVSSLTGRTIAVVALSLAAVGLQRFAVDVHSAGGAMLALLVAFGAGLASLVVLVGLLRIAAEVVEGAQLPSARLV